MSLRPRKAPSATLLVPCAMRHAPCAIRSSHAYHLYVVKINFKEKALERASVFTALRENGISANVHYIPVHLHTFYREKFHTGTGLCPVAEVAYEQIVSLPMFPSMTDENVEKVIGTIKNMVMQ